MFISRLRRQKGLPGRAGPRLGVPLRPYSDRPTRPLRVETVTKHGTVLPAPTSKKSWARGSSYNPATTAGAHNSYYVRSPRIWHSKALRLLIETGTF